MNGGDKKLKTDHLLRSFPEKEGIPSAVLLDMLTELEKLDSLHSIMLLRHGKVCMEGWWHPYSPEIPHILFSLSKSFVSAAVGIAQAERLLSVSDKLISFFPEYESVVTDPRMKEVTLRHLLTMTSGHALCARSSMLADPEGNWARGFLASALSYEPGTHFAYNSAASYMLSAVLHKVTGENVREFLMPKLFEPLGITPGIWECCPLNINTGGWGLYLKTADIAKFAQLLLNGGRWYGQQLIPEDYLHEATSGQADTSANEWPDWKLGYGYQFWKSSYGFRADGASGQYALVIPEKDMAIAITAGVEDMQQILTVIWEKLIPAVQEESLLPSPENMEKLTGKLRSLQIYPAAGELEKRHEPQAWHFAPNKSGITAVSVSFSERECRLEFDTVKGTEILTAGFGFHCCGELQLNDHMKRKVAASAAWKDEKILEIHICCYECAFQEIFTIDFNSADAPFSGSCRFNTFREPFLPVLTTV